MKRADRHIVFIGTGSHIPNRRVPNSVFEANRFYLDYGEPVDPADNRQTIEKFQQITEIGERRWVEDDVVTSDIAFDAAAKAVASAGIDPETLDYVILAHNFGDVAADLRVSDFCPTLAARVKRRLGISNPECVAYDLPFGCPGWVQGVIQADYFLASGDASCALVVGAETLSRVSDPHDRDSMLYSDGAGAAVLEAVAGGSPVGILAHATRSDTIDHSGLMWMGSSYDPDRRDGALYLKMYGRKLYEYALNHVPGVVKTSLDRAGLTLTDVHKLLIHQANAKMDDAIIKRLFRLYGMREVPSDVMPMTISWLGNSSVATVPTLLDLIHRGELDGHDVSPGDIVVLASVGAGMNINSVVYRWPDHNRVER
jgi:3-oxoacyl-[acyl-carrier-protein] synthase-3